jgi:hypothetical protein
VYYSVVLYILLREVYYSVVRWVALTAALSLHCNALRPQEHEGLASRGSVSVLAMLAGMCVASDGPIEMKADFLFEVRTCIDFLFEVRACIAR